MTFALTVMIFPIGVPLPLAVAMDVTPCCLRSCSARDSSSFETLASGKGMGKSERLWTFRSSPLDHHTETHALYNFCGLPVFREGFCFEEWISECRDWHDCQRQQSCSRMHQRKRHEISVSFSQVIVIALVEPLWKSKPFPPF